jgi:hypothetical protein
VIHNSMLSLDQDNVLDWGDFCSRLSEEGNKTSPCASKRIWGLLSQEMQGVILDAVQTNGGRETFKLSLVEALNNLLKHQDFYQEKYFQDINLTSEAKELLEQSQQGLSHEETQRLNRLLLEASYPEEIAQSYRGCQYYSAKQFVDVSNLDSLSTLSSNEVEDTLKYMESLGPRQRNLVRLLRLMLEGYRIEENGYEIAEIARQTGRHRTTIPKELYGTSEREKDEKGNVITYHQAGAFEIFRAIYTGAIFSLERAEKSLWHVVNRRDFSADAVRPGFSKVSSELDVSKREAIEHYIDGWNWIKAQSTKGGGSVSRFEDDRSEQKIKQTRRARQVVKVDEVPHPDFHTLLTYAEGGLDQDVRKRIAGHVLICEHCSAELESIETKIIPEKERPLSIAERGHWIAARAAGRLNKASDVAGNNDSGRMPVGLTKWFNWLRLPKSLTYGLAVAVVALLLVLMLRETRYRSLEERLTSLTTSVDSLERQNESLQQENAVLRDQAEKSTASAEEAQKLLTDRQRSLEQTIAQLQSENNVLKTLPIQRASQPRQMVTVQDTVGTAIVGNGVTVNPAGDTNATFKLPPDLSQAVRELVTAGNVMPTQLARNALATIRDKTTRGESRGGGTAENLKPLPISPMLTAVRTTTPTLRWLPVPNAQSYKVTVVYYWKGNEKEKKVWYKEVGTQTELILDADTLSQGQICIWEVEATVSEREQVTVSPPAGFWVLDEKALHDVEIAEQGYSSSALVLSSVYAKYGLYEEAIPQVKRLKALNPTSRFVETMLRRLRQQSGKEWRTSRQ